MRPNITYRHMAHSAVLDEKIGELSARLQALHPRITSIHVAVDELDHRKEQGRLFEVRVDVRAPRADVVANHQRHEDPYVVVRDAFDVVIRQLTEAVDRMRGEVKHHAGERGDEAQP